MHKIIRQQRQKKGINQAELARLVGVSRATIVNFEAGNQSLGSVALSKILKVLNLEIK